MTVNKKRKRVHEEPAQRKKKVRSSGSQTVTKTEKRIQAVTEAEDDDWFETKTKARKKESVKEDECSDQLNLKKNKNKKRKVSFELPKEACSEDAVYLEGHQDLEPEEESEVQCSKGKVFKKKRKKDPRHASLSLESKQNSDVELSSHYSDGIQENKFAFTKSRKNNTLNLNLDGEVTKKKKKKDIFSLALADIQDSECKQSQKDCKETNVPTSEGGSITGESHGTDTMHNDGKGYVRRKKKKKKKSDSFLPPADHHNNISAVRYSPTVLSNFRKRHRKEIRLTDKEEKDSTENPESIRETKKKKKKKKSKDVSSLKYKDDQCYSQRVLDKHLPTLQEVESQEEELSGKKIWKKSKNNDEATKKKKKRKIQKDKETTFSKVYLSNDCASKSQKIMPVESNKKNKERKMKPAECVTGDTAGDRVLCNSDHMLSDKKRKKVPEDSAEESRSNANIKKKRIKIEDRGDKMLEDVDDVTIVQEKKGNCDEINIDKVRRRALQEEIDRESGKTNVFSPEVKMDTKIGQWSTAAFQSSERGMKFLRLMGGFKKGSAPAEDLSVTTNKPNMALNREGEEKLQQALKMEFDKAMDLKQHRRIGLGFQPAANKKVYIDKYASRSLKFED
ncbi:lysine-rich nucleolar protein 1 [Numida meleagris]|uniref:lysine-rich nucleolar protein 1 n=1 Tax=Numida meleagris TaxID=8996 RepID=UPI000B3DAE45|nr:lysine-rich nucleolar protein 1 [Numida meleagris]